MKNEASLIKSSMAFAYSRGSPCFGSSMHAEHNLLRKARYLLRKQGKGLTLAIMSLRGGLAKPCGQCVGRYKAFPKLKVAWYGVDGALMGTSTISKLLSVKGRFTRGTLHHSHDDGCHHHHHSCCEGKGKGKGKGKG